MIARRPLGLVFVWASTLLAPQHYGWTHFVSAHHQFSAFYPPGWHELTPGLGGLQVITFPDSERVGGIIIPPAGAIITVGPTGYPGKTVNDVVMASLVGADGPPILDQTILTDGLGPDGCPTLREVQTYLTLGSATHPVLERDTAYYCQVHGRIFTVDLEYYRGNKNAAMLESLARDVAMTLRVEKLSSRGARRPNRHRRAHLER
jgi:hypothetical protein